MGLLDRIDARAKNIRLGGGVGFRQAPFWTTDTLADPLWAPPVDERERIAQDFEGYVQALYKANGPVAACIFARMFAFSEARFQWRRFRDGRPQPLFGDQQLVLLERPWPGGTTGELLARMEQDVSLAGNFFATTADDNGRIGRASEGGPNRRVVRMRPDWVTILAGSMRSNATPFSLDARVLAYEYRPPPGTLTGDDDAVMLLPGEVCHYSPIPDPMARFRGMSWLTPVLAEIGADRAATIHKGRFFENNATLQTVVSLDATVGPTDFDAFVRRFNASHRGARNAYKTLFVGGGADVNVVGANMREIDFKATQGGGETRIAAAAGVPPTWVMFSEGLAGSSLNAGNFGQARRRFADGTIRPLWRSAAASLEGTIVQPASEGASLWYDDRDIPFVREDAKDVATVRQIEAQTVAALLREGFTPESATQFVQTGDWSVLAHSGLYSVQLQALNTGDDAAADVAKRVAELVQKVVGGTPDKVVLSAEEARALLNQAGADLTGRAPEPPAPVPSPNGNGAAPVA